MRRFRVRGEEELTPRRWTFLVGNNSTPTLFGVRLYDRLSRDGDGNEHHSPIKGFLPPPQKKVLKICILCTQNNGGFFEHLQKSLKMYAVILVL